MRTGMSELDRFKRLETLPLDCTELDDAGLVHLAGLQHLQSWGQVLGGSGLGDIQNTFC